MIPENDLLKRIDELERRLNALQAFSEYDPETIRAISQATLKSSGANPADYDKAVNEAGLASYNVADVFDGFLVTPDGKLIGYYNP